MQGTVYGYGRPMRVPSSFIWLCIHFSQSLFICSSSSMRTSKLCIFLLYYLLRKALSIFSSIQKNGHNYQSFGFETKNLRFNCLQVYRNLFIKIIAYPVQIKWIKLLLIPARFSSILRKKQRVIFRKIETGGMAFMFQFNQGRISSQFPNPFSTDLFVNNCGMHFVQGDVLEECRSNGRGDFQLLYVVEGEPAFILNGQSVQVSAGTLILYKPHEPQKYIYSTEKNIRVYWIHFFGTVFEDILKRMPFIQQGCMHIGISNEIIKGFEKIITYMQNNTDHYNLMCCGFFLQILAQIENLRRINGDTDVQNPAIRKSIEKVITLINSNCAAEYSVEELASICNLSESYFFRSFKLITGKSPRNYRLAVQISQAKHYLSSTDMPISAIAQSIGFPDPLYFSRIFKKYTGLSPRDYRRQNSKSYF